MKKIRECPFCAHSNLALVVVEQSPRTLAIQCPECGAVGPRSPSADAGHAVFAWNRRLGRTPLVTVGYDKWHMRKSVPARTEAPGEAET